MVEAVEVGVEKGFRRVFLDGLRADYAVRWIDTKSWDTAVPLVNTLTWLIWRSPHAQSTIDPMEYKYSDTCAAVPPEKTARSP